MERYSLILEGFFFSNERGTAEPTRMSVKHAAKTF